MADQRISELNAITGANTADDDLFVIVDTSTNETKKIAKSELVSTINAALVDGAPTTLDTLNELAAALNDDANFATTVTNSLAGKVDTSGDTMTGNLSFGDNDKAIFGAGSDLQIYHSGTTSIINENGTGNLALNTNGANIQFTKGFAENLATFNADGSCTFYYDNSVKLATTSTGIDVAGTATMDGLTVDGVSKSNYSVATDSLAAFESGAGVYTYTSGGIGVLAAYSSGATKGLLKLDASDLQVAKGSQKIISADGNGDISFYEDTGTTAKFFWDASAESLELGTSSGMTPTASLAINEVVGGTPAIEIIPTTDDPNNITAAIRLWGTVFGTANRNSEIRNVTNRGTDANELAFATNGSERMRIDSSGNVGIGTSSPNEKLRVVGTSGNVQFGAGTGGNAVFVNAYDSGSIYMTASAANSTAFGLGSASNIPTFFMTNNTERMRIDSSGNVGIGTSSPASQLEMSKAGGTSLRIKDTTSGYTTVIEQNSNTDTQIRANNPIALYTGGTERMRINSSGAVLVNTQSSLKYADAKLQVKGDSNFWGGTFETTSTTSGRGALSCLVENTAAPLVRFSYAGSGTAVPVGAITTNGSSTSYVTSSDYRLKEDWQPVANASDRVAQLKPINFAWKVDGKRVDGFLAHELAEVVPEAVTGEKDAMRTEEYEVSPAVLDEEGNVVTEAVMGEREVPDYQGIDQSKLVPLLTAALQEALTEIDNLKQRVSALETN